MQILRFSNKTSDKKQVRKGKYLGTPFICNPQTKSMNQRAVWGSKAVWALVSLLRKLLRWPKGSEERKATWVRKPKNTEKKKNLSVAMGIVSSMRTQEENTDIKRFKMLKNNGEAEDGNSARWRIKLNLRSKDYWPLLTWAASACQTSHQIGEYIIVLYW